MTDRLSITVPYRVRFDECGPDGLARASSLLRYAQDVAWIHSESRGFDRRWYADRRLAWLVRGAELRILGPIGIGEMLDVTTRVNGLRRVLARRLTTFAGRDGSAVAEIVTDWAMTGEHGPARVPPEIGAAFGAGTIESFSPLRVRSDAEPEPDAGRAAPLLTEQAVRDHEIDPMGHMNNAAYLDRLEEAVAAAGLAEVLATRPRAYRLEYLAAARSGEQLTGTTWSTPTGVVFRLVNAAGTTLFRARVGPAVSRPSA